MSAKVAVLAWMAVMTLLNGTRTLFKTSALAQNTLSLMMGGMSLDWITLAWVLSKDVKACSSLTTDASII